MYRNPQRYSYNPVLASQSRKQRQRRNRYAALFALFACAVVAVGVFLNPSSNPVKTKERAAFQDVDTGVSSNSFPGEKAQVAEGNQYWPPNTYDQEAFTRAWQRVDGPITANRVVRGWNYGPTILATFAETNKKAQLGLQLVRYWDKGRMQINGQVRDIYSPTYIEYGSLAKELISGAIDLGGGDVMSLSPASMSAVGDSVKGNPAPTYAALGRISTGRAQPQADLLIGNQLDGNGTVSEALLGGYEKYEVRNVYYAQNSGHNIPNVFYDFLNKSGTILQNGQYINGKLWDWEPRFGLPLSEAYWVKATFNGQPQTVLIQVYEKQILIFNPASKPEYKVEQANVGRDYYTWRYGPASFVPVATKPGEAPDPNVLTARLTIGNEKIGRVIDVQNGKLTRNTLLNRLTGQLYSDVRAPGNPGGFSLQLLNPEGKQIRLDGSQFTVTGYNLPTSATEQRLEIKAQAVLEGHNLDVRLYYRVLPGQDFIEKWYSFEPGKELANWKVRLSYVEDMATVSKLSAAAPTTEEERASLTDYLKESYYVPGGAIFTNVMSNKPDTEGIYFFSASTLGLEYMTEKDNVRRLTMMHEEYQDLADGFTSGKAVVGVYTGPVDLGFKRFTEYVSEFYGQMSSKKQGVWYHSWYAFTNQINEQILTNQLDQMKKLGVYDVLHVDAGWESNYPLQIDPQKFPQGLKPLAEKAAANNISLGLWINPFSNSYSQYVNYSGLHQEHPEWHVPGRTAPDGTGPFGVNTGYYDYVKEKLTKLVKENNVKVIYWDGADWNIPDMTEPGLNEEQKRLARVKGVKRLAELMDELHKIQPDLVVVAWNAIADIHLLNAVDQLQLTDVWKLPIGQSEVMRHQQFYAATYRLPYYSIWGDWYSISYRENNDNNLTLDTNILTYAESNMIGTGGLSAGASIDLNKASPALLDHIHKLFSWRKQYEDYFKVYQHIFQFPTGEEVDGEGHIVDGKGFLLLNNPTDKPVQVALPLTAVELELDPAKSYKLYDWSDYTTGKPMGEAKPGQGVIINIPAKSVKVIGLDVAGKG